MQVGNAAADQLQLGVYGDLFSIVALYVEHGNVLDAETGRSLASIADTACDRWQQKDAGMWELHDPQHYTTSKLGCWQALTKAVELAEAGQIPATRPAGGPRPRGSAAGSRTTPGTPTAAPTSCTPAATPWTARSCCTPSAASTGASG